MRPEILEILFLNCIYETHNTELEPYILEVKPPDRGIKNEECKSEINPKANKVFLFSH
jgi:hypothetical protein